MAAKDGEAYFGPPKDAISKGPTDIGCIPPKKRFLCTYKHPVTSASFDETHVNEVAKAPEDPPHEPDKLPSLSSANEHPLNLSVIGSVLGPNTSKSLSTGPLSSASCVAPVVTPVQESEPPVDNLRIGSSAPLTSDCITSASTYAVSSDCTTTTTCTTSSVATTSTTSNGPSVSVSEQNVTHKSTEGAEDEASHVDILKRLVPIKFAMKKRLANADGANYWSRFGEANLNLLLDGVPETLKSQLEAGTVVAADSTDSLVNNSASENHTILKTVPSDQHCGGMAGGLLKVCRKKKIYNSTPAVNVNLPPRYLPIVRHMPSPRHVTSSGLVIGTNKYVGGSVVKRKRTPQWMPTKLKPPVRHSARLRNKKVAKSFLAKAMGTPSRESPRKDDAEPSEAKKDVEKPSDLEMKDKQSEPYSENIAHDIPKVASESDELKVKNTSETSVKRTKTGGDGSAKRSRASNETSVKKSNGETSAKRTKTNVVTPKPKSSIPDVISSDEVVEANDLSSSVEMQDGVGQTVNADVNIDLSVDQASSVTDSTNNLESGSKQEMGESQSASTEKVSEKSADIALEGDSPLVICDVRSLTTEESVPKVDEPTKVEVPSCEPDVGSKDEAQKVNDPGLSVPLQEKGPINTPSVPLSKKRKRKPKRPFDFAGSDTLPKESGAVKSAEDEVTNSQKKAPTMVLYNGGSGSRWKCSLSDKQLLQMCKVVLDKLPERMNRSPVKLNETASTDVAESRSDVKKDINSVHCEDDDDSDPEKLVIDTGEMPVVNSSESVLGAKRPRPSRTKRNRVRRKKRHHTPSVKAVQPIPQTEPLSSDVVIKESVENQDLAGIVFKSNESVQKTSSCELAAEEGEVISTNIETSVNSPCVVNETAQYVEPANETVNDSVLEKSENAGVPMSSEHSASKMEKNSTEQEQKLDDIETGEVKKGKSRSKRKVVKRRSAKMPGGKSLKVKICQVDVEKEVDTSAPEVAKSTVTCKCLQSGNHCEETCELHAKNLSIKDEITGSDEKLKETKDSVSAESSEVVSDNPPREVAPLKINLKKLLAERCDQERSEESVASKSPEVHMLGEQESFSLKISVGYENNVKKKTSSRKQKKSKHKRRSEKTSDVSKDLPPVELAPTEPDKGLHVAEKTSKTSSVIENADVESASVVIERLSPKKSHHDLPKPDLATDNSGHKDVCSEGRKTTRKFFSDNRRISTEAVLTKPTAKSTTNSSIHKESAKMKAKVMANMSSDLKMAVLDQVKQFTQQLHPPAELPSETECSQSIPLTKDPSLAEEEQVNEPMAKPATPETVEKPAECLDLLNLLADNSVSNVPAQSQPISDMSSESKNLVGDSESNHLKRNTFVHGKQIESWTSDVSDDSVQSAHQDSSEKKQVASETVPETVHKTGTLKGTSANNGEFRIPTSPAPHSIHSRTPDHTLSPVPKREKKPYEAMADNMPPCSVVVSCVNLPKIAASPQLSSSEQSEWECELLGDLESDSNANSAASVLPKKVPEPVPNKRGSRKPKVPASRHLISRIADSPIPTKNSDLYNFDAEPDEALNSTNLTSLGTTYPELGGHKNPYMDPSLCSKSKRGRGRGMSRGKRGTRAKGTSRQRKKFSFEGKEDPTYMPGMGRNKGNMDEVFEDEENDDDVVENYCQQPVRKVEQPTPQPLSPSTMNTRYQFDTCNDHLDDKEETSPDKHYEVTQVSDKAFNARLFALYRHDRFKTRNKAKLRQDVDFRNTDWLESASVENDSKGEDSCDVYPSDNSTEKSSETVSVKKSKKRRHRDKHKEILTDSPRNSPSPTSHIKLKIKLPRPDSPLATSEIVEVKTTPSRSQNTPSQNTPSISQNTPSISQNLPSISQNTPSISQNTPSLSQNTPSRSPPGLAANNVYAPVTDAISDDEPPRLSPIRHPHTYHPYPPVLLEAPKLSSHLMESAMNHQVPDLSDCRVPSIPSQNLLQVQHETATAKSNVPRMRVANKISSHMSRTMESSSESSSDSETNDEGESDMKGKKWKRKNVLSERQEKQSTYYMPDHSPITSEDSDQGEFFSTSNIAFHVEDSAYNSDVNHSFSSSMKENDGNFSEPPSSVDTGNQSTPSYDAQLRSQLEELDMDWGIEGLIKEALELSRDLQDKFIRNPRSFDLDSLIKSSRTLFSDIQDQSVKEVENPVRPEAAVCVQPLLDDDVYGGQSPVPPSSLAQQADSVFKAPLAVLDNITVSKRPPRRRKSHGAYSPRARSPGFCTQDFFTTEDNAMDRLLCQPSNRNCGADSPNAHYLESHVLDEADAENGIDDILLGRHRRSFEYIGLSRDNNGETESMWLNVDGAIDLSW